MSDNKLVRNLVEWLYPKLVFWMLENGFGSPWMEYVFEDAFIKSAEKRKDAEHE